jgi:mannan endo-1,4-beta-mannosidase
MRRIIFSLFFASLTIWLPDICTAESQQGWVKAHGDKFIKDGKPFRFIGATSVNLLMYDDWGLNIEEAVKGAKENNISVFRVYLDWKWAKYEDFDLILDIASKYGIYVILNLADCCCVGDYPDLKKYFQVHTPFCDITNKQSLEAFKKRIKQVIERKNSINGKIYRDDPVIFAWEIANELPYQNFRGSQVKEWLSDISGYIKSLDKKHLITIGIDTNNPEFDRGPGIYGLFNASAIDFFSFHLYPSFEIAKANDIALYDGVIRQIEPRVKNFLKMGKPVIMGEFGFSDSVDLNDAARTNSAEFYSLVFKELIGAAFSAGASGAMFWGWGVPEEKAIPMWWSRESHTPEDKSFCSFIKKYTIGAYK